MGHMNHKMLRQIVLQSQQDTPAVTAAAALGETLTPFTASALLLPHTWRSRQATTVVQHFAAHMC